MDRRRFLQALGVAAAEKFQKLETPYYPKLEITPGGTKPPGR